MHEIVAVENMFRIMNEECTRGNVVPKRVLCEIGGLSGYKKEPIVFYFELMKRENGFCDCRIDVTEVCGKVKCLDCGKESDLDDGVFVFCRSCNSKNVEVVNGRDFKVLEIVGE